MCCRYYNDTGGEKIKSIIIEKYVAHDNLYLLKVARFNQKTKHTQHRKCVCRNRYCQLLVFARVPTSFDIFRIFYFYILTAAATVRVTDTRNSNPLRRLIFFEFVFHRHAAAAPFVHRYTLSRKRYVIIIIILYTAYGRRLPSNVNTHCDQV